MFILFYEIQDYVFLISKQWSHVIEQKSCETLMSCSKIQQKLKCNLVFKVLLEHIVEYTWEKVKGKNLLEMSWKILKMSWKKISSKECDP